MIDRAKSEGATLLAGGNRVDREGYYIEPTVFTDVDPDSELAQNEVFGPVLAIFKFSTEEEAIALANNSRYALSSYIQTQDLNRALRVAAALNSAETLLNGAAHLPVGRPFCDFCLSAAGHASGPPGTADFP